MGLISRVSSRTYRDRESNMVFLSKILKGGPDYATVPDSWKPETWKMSSKGTPFEKVEQNLAKNNLRFPWMRHYVWMAAAKKNALQQHELPLVLEAFAFGH